MLFRIRDFTEYMYNVVYFAEDMTKLTLEEEDDYSETLTEDYSTYFSDYDQLTGMINPISRLPGSIPLRSTQSGVETLPTPQKALPRSESMPIPTKKDIDVQTTDSLHASMAKGKPKEEETEVKPTNKEKEKKEEAPFLYRLDESGRKKGFVVEATSRRRKRVNNYDPLENERHLSTSFMVFKGDINIC